MELRAPNPTADNSSIPQQHRLRHAPAAAPLKQPAASPVSVDTTSVSHRLQKELMSLMMSGGDLGVSAFPEGESIFTWIGTIEGGKETMTNGLQLMIAEQFFCPFRVYWESLTQRVLSTAMLQLCGTIKKITEKWFTNSTSLERHLKADLCNSLVADHKFR